MDRHKERAQPGLHSEFWAVQSYIERPCFNFKKRLLTDKSCFQLKSSNDQVSHPFPCDPFYGFEGGF